jgi:hypothetical protein
MSAPLPAPLPALQRIAAGLAEVAAGIAALAAATETPTALVDPEMVYVDTSKPAAPEAEKPAAEPTKKERKARTVAPEPVKTETPALEPEEIKLPEKPTEVSADELRALCRNAAAKVGVGKVNAALGKTVADMNAAERVIAKPKVEELLADKAA